MTVRSMVEQCMHIDGRMTLIHSLRNSTCYDILKQKIQKQIGNESVNGNILHPVTISNRSLVWILYSRC